MTTILMPVLDAEPARSAAVPFWRRAWHAVRTALAAIKERRAEFARCAALAEEYRQTTHVTAGRIRGTYPSHRAPRPVRTRRAPRAPREARHTLGQGRRHVELPRDWRKRFEMSHRMAWARPTVAEILAGV